MSFETYRISAPIGMLLWTLVTTLFLSGDSTRSLPPQAVELASLFLKNSSFRQLYSDREGVDRKEQFEALEVRVVNELVVELKRISYQLFPAHEADDIAAEAYVMLAQFLLVREPDCLKLESVTAKERLLMTRDLFAFSSRMNDLFSVQSLCVALGTRGQLEVPAANPTPQPSEEEAAHHDMTTLSQGMEIHTHHLPEPCRKLMEHNLNGPLRHDESTPVDGNGIPAAMYERVLPILSSPEFQACVDMYEAPSGTAGSMESTRIQATELASKLQEYIVRTLKMSPFNPATSEKLAQILLQFIPDCLMQEMDPSTQKSPNAPSPAIDMPRLLVTAPNAQMLRELCRTITGHHAVAMQQQDVDENGHAHPRDPLPAGVMDGEPNEWFGGELAHSAITDLPFSPIPPHNMMQQRQHRQHGEEGAVKSEDMQGTDMVVHEHPHHPHPYGEEGAVKSEDMQGTDMVVHEHPHHPHPHGEEGAVKSEDMQSTDMDGGVAEETLIHHAAKLMQQVLPETMNIDKDTIQAHLRALRNTLIEKLQASGGTPPAEAETGVVQEALIPEMPSEPNVQPLNADEQVVKNSFAVMSDVVQNAPRYPVGATSNEVNTSLTTLNIVLVVCLGISLLALVAVVIRMRQQRSSGCDNQYSNEISEGLYSKMGNSEC